jgi:C3HC zinc finger-like
MEEFIKRLKSFKLSTWPCKPKELSPVECAKRGYLNSSKDTISCTICGKVLIFLPESALIPIFKHKDSCQFNIPIRISYQIPEFSIISYKNRSDLYSHTDLLPQVLYPFKSLDQNHLKALFPSFPKVYLAKVYALFGWRPGQNKLYCELCGIEIECMRKEYALFKSKNLYNLFSETKIQKKHILRHNIEIAIGRYVDLIACHRYYCPWINDITLEDYSYFTNNPVSKYTGWKILLVKLSQRANSSI